jgi:hypothetical protein
MLHHVSLRRVSMKTLRRLGALGWAAVFAMKNALLTMGCRVNALGRQGANYLGGCRSGKHGSGMVAGGERA